VTGLVRFIEAQSQDYERVVAELEQGSKRSHWIWYIFPQVAGLGRSETSRLYAIDGMAEARAYLAEPLLKARLDQCTDLMLAWLGRRNASTILGELDALKFRSSMTLFEAAARGGNEGEHFSRALDGFFEGQRDDWTLRLLKDNGA
jgi:uncharacterized protein (DUF1810 family)